MPKEQFRETDIARRIESVQFGVESSGEMGAAASVRVHCKQLYVGEEGRAPAPHGPLDRRMGTNTKDKPCDTCRLALADCPGHFGYIDLALPVFHVGYFRALVSTLQALCKACARLTLPPHLAERYRRRTRARASLPYLAKKQLRAAVLAAAKKHARCPHCGALNGVVKKGSGGVLRIVHDRSRLKGPAGGGGVEELSPLRVLALLRRVPDGDLPLLGLRARPETLVLERLPVPPLCIRPTVASDLKAGTTEDDLTMKQSEILLINDVIGRHVASGGKTELVHEDWEYLQLHTALYINSELSGIPPSMQPKKAARGLVQRLKGKAGRFRGNLSGKRVDFSARTVISPDPNLHISEVGIPLAVARILTFPERVCAANVRWLRALVEAGPDAHPGANYVQLGGGGARRYLRYGDRAELARQLRPGDTVERHLLDGDVVLFNRQPSLHRLSIMAHRVRVHPHRTFRFNECVCTPYNADFDGDEMNVHVPQTQEARAEAAVLLANTANLVTPRNGDLLIAATQDFITAAYLLTSRDTFLTAAQAHRLAAALLAPPEHAAPLRLPPPALLRPRRLYTGKQIFSLILRGAPVNMETRARNYGGHAREMCAAEGWVVVARGQLVAGAACKATLGSGSKAGIFYAVLREYGETMAARAMWRLARLASAYLTERGFSLGLGDVTPGRRLLAAKRELVAAGMARCEGHIQELERGTLAPAAGCSPAETLEACVLGELSAIRERAARACFAELPPSNAPLLMALSGSKGSNINISQMIACVGQQALNGRRVPNGFEDRSLPHFHRHTRLPAARGFVENSFYSGLTPTEFFFHTMGGREGLVDTAVKTAETGYLQRRLVKALEDLVVQWDGSVRNASMELVQLAYGADGLDPAHAEHGAEPAHLPRLLLEARAACPCPLACTSEPDGAPLPPEQLRRAADETLALDDWATCPAQYRARLLAWAAELGAQRERVSLRQLVWVLRRAHDKYQRALVEPGTAVGALAAQSIGEPGTQMTLKTFHFAGVASMNITQGVPRLKEIINASRSISTPLMSVPLSHEPEPEPEHEHEQGEEGARRVKARLERTTLGEITRYVEEVYSAGDCFLRVQLDGERVRLLALHLDVHHVLHRVMTWRAWGGRWRVVDGRAVGEWTLCLWVGAAGAGAGAGAGSGAAASAINMALASVARALPHVLVCGLAHVTRAVIAHEEAAAGAGAGARARYKLLVEGLGLREVVGARGVRGQGASTNSIMEVASALGIEAACTCIAREVHAVMQAHAITIDPRHLMLLAAQMTARGEVLGITRYGLAKLKESVLNLASFEKTAEHMFEAATHHQRDPLSGVSEAIILGLPPPIGTHCFRLLHRHTPPAPAPAPPTPAAAPTAPPLLFDQPRHHASIWAAT